MVRKTLQSTLCLFLAPLLVAQQASQISPPGQTLGEPSTLTIRRGTEVSLHVAQDINSATAKVGDSVRFTLAEDLAVDGKVVAPAGTACIASISMVRQKDTKHDGDIRVGEIRMNVSGQTIRLRGGSLKPEDWDDSWAFIAGAMIIFPIGIAAVLHMANDKARHQTAPQPIIETKDMKYSGGEVFYSSIQHRVRVRANAVPAPDALKVKTD